MALTALQQTYVNWWNTSKPNNQWTTNTPKYNTLAKTCAEFASVPLNRSVLISVGHRTKVSWHVPSSHVHPERSHPADRRAGGGTDHLSHRSHPSFPCPLFISLSYSINTPIHLIPHSITSTHCMPLPTIHLFSLTLIPLFPSSASPSLCPLPFSRSVVPAPDSSLEYSGRKDLFKRIKSQKEIVQSCLSNRACLLKQRWRPADLGPVVRRSSPAVTGAASRCSCSATCSATAATAAPTSRTARPVSAAPVVFKQKIKGHEK